VLKETNEIETKKKLTKQEVRNRLLEEISLIDSTLRGSHKRIDNLQSKVDSYKTQFAGLRKMVSTMKRTVEEREQSIAALEQRVRSLETEVAEKDRMITERDSTIQVQTSTIDQQHKQLTTAYYIVGSRSDLEKKGIIKKEGGFLWGLLGSTTMLANGINMDYFTPIAKNEQTTIDVVGNIDEISLP
jgi:chromosome segregation ATPase